MKRSGMTRNYVRILITICSLLCSGSLFTSPAAAGDYNVYLTADHFAWKEFGDDGSRQLKESGTLYGVGFIYTDEFRNHLTVRPAVELFGGTVDYDGQTQSGIPLTTKVDYFGIKLGGDLGRRFRPGQSVFIEPFAGLGVRAWVRDINDGTAANGSPTSDFRESWITVYAPVGLRGGVDISSGTQLFAEAGIKLPLYNENTAYQSYAGLGSDITVHPGKRSSLFAEAGLKIKRFKGSVFYDSMRFTKSNTVITTYGYFLYYTNWQPKSALDLYGVKLGVEF
jgi:hypothetical protein